jgi:hypothetical protein
MPLPPPQRQRPGACAPLSLWPGFEAEFNPERPSLGGTCDHFPLLGEHLSYPVHHRAHASGATQIAMNDDPILGREFGDWRGQPLEQGMAVADIARQRSAPGSRADRFQMSALV